jgi:hypothetical protein
MIKNFLIVTIRSLLKNKIYSFINISGLAIGITCSILILLWVFDEISYDRFHPKAESIYQVWVHTDFDNKIHSWKYKRLVEPHIIDNENRWYGFWYPVYVELNDPSNISDVEFQEKFTPIKLTSKLASLFASLAIIITDLGLFGLASYITEQRTKEISIRKVMGATVLNIITVVSKDFTRLVILAFLIAAPLAWWLLNMYLERYPISIDIQFWIFPLTGIFALVFALSIVMIQALRSAHANPAETLRNE